jgi:hypothetical protein
MFTDNVKACLTLSSQLAGIYFIEAEMFLSHIYCTTVLENV